MKAGLAFALSLICASWGSSCHATDYYVSDCQTGAVAQCLAGNNTNDGRSPDRPWQNLSKVASVFATLQPGDRILFARGSAQLGGLSIYNPNSRATNPIVVDAYWPKWSSGGALPILNVPLDQDGLSFADSGLSDHDEGYVVRNLSLRGPSPQKRTGVFIYNDVDHVLLENLEISNFSGGVNCAASNAPNNAQSDAKNDNITLRNSIIRGNGGQGYYNGSCSNVAIEGNLFDNNGFGFFPLFKYHNIYIGDEGHNVSVRSNILTRSAVGDGLCQGVPIVAHGVQTGLVIENNYIDESTGAGNGCYGIQVNPGYSLAESLRGTVIRSNTIVNVGANGISIGSCPDCVVENNKIVQAVKRPFFYGINMPAENITEGVDAADAHLTVRNNTIYIAGGDKNNYGIQVGKYGSQHVVVSNVVYFDSASAGASCFSTLGLISNRFISFDYNLCFNASGAGRYSADYQTLSQAAQAGFDRNGLNRSPLFVRTPRAENKWSLALDPKSPTFGGGHPNLSFDLTTRNIGITLSKAKVPATSP